MDKYNSHKIKSRFGDFDSRLEYNRYLYLKSLEKEGKISDLRAHPMHIELVPRLTRKTVIELKTKTKIVETVDEQAVTYTPDFMYTMDGKTVIEEVKSSGTKTARDWSIRRKLLKQWIQKKNNELGVEFYEYSEYGLK